MSGSGCERFPVSFSGDTPKRSDDTAEAASDLARTFIFSVFREAVGEGVSPAPLKYAVRFSGAGCGLCWEETDTEGKALAMAQDIMTEYRESGAEVSVYMRLPLAL